MPFSLISFEMPSHHQISEYLHSVKVRYETDLIDPQNSGTIHFVMGNESADMDSIISSIAYAYLLQQQSLQQSEFHIPLMNIPREELALRKDVLYLFDLFNISADDLLFLDDDVPLDTLFAQKRLRLNLVDHNSLKPRQKHLCDIVERIVDHHHDERKHYPLVSEHDKLIDIAGSSATLIAEKVLHSSRVEISPELAMLLLAPILMDTGNLKSSKKTTGRDVAIAAALKDLASSMLPADFYHALMAAKNDISGLTPPMLLSKDFKEYADGEIFYGISSLPSTVCWGMDDLEEVGPEIQKYAGARNLDYLILLMSCNEPQAKRRILVYSPSQELLNGFHDYVLADEVLQGLFIPDGSSEVFLMMLYRTEIAIARKQLQPLLRFSE
jgi:exopolyphosphatase